jgi:2-polyprenyl-3-methyl-5-hydroxy-6-metoxy-1,4-benzoquinol methylase
MPKICCQKNTKILRSFNNLSLCNKFIKKPSQKETKFTLKLSQCKSCGLLQLNKALKANMIAQEHEWIRYFEPEDHLSNLSSKIRKVCKFSKKTTIAGITYKDDSLIKHLKKRTDSKSWRIKPKKDLKIKFESAASETVLPKINSQNVLKLQKKYGKADILVGRHILEHAPNTSLFLNQLKKLVKSNGYILFEVPDCSKQIKYLDYTMLWEEHNLYFTPEILKIILKLIFLI